MSSTAAYLAIIDKFLDKQNVHSIQRSGENLKFWVLIVSIVYLSSVAGLYCVKDKFASNRPARNLLVIEFTLPPPTEPPILDPTKETVMAEKSKTGNSLNTVSARPSNDQSPTSAPIKQLVIKRKIPTIGGQPVLSPRMKTLAVLNRQNTESFANAPLKVNDQEKSTKKIEVAVNQIAPPAAMNPSVDNMNEGPQLGGIGGHVAGPGTGSESRIGNGGGGNDLAGKGGQQIAMINASLTMGNIAPYRKDMLARIAQEWQPTKHYAKIQSAKNIVVIISIDSAGQLLNCELITSSGDEKLDKYAAETIGRTVFAPLPNWFKGDHLKFKVELAKVEAIRSDI